MAENLQKDGRIRTGSEVWRSGQGARANPPLGPRARELCWGRGVVTSRRDPPPYAAHWGGQKVSGGAGAILEEPATEWEWSGAAVVADSSLLPTLRSAG